MKIFLDPQVKGLSFHSENPIPCLVIFMHEEIVLRDVCDSKMMAVLYAAADVIVYLYVLQGILISSTSCMEATMPMVLPDPFSPKPSIQACK